MIFIDTWGFKAFIDRREPKHSQVKQFLENAWNQNDAVCTSDYVIDETITLISYKVPSLNQRGIFTLLKT